MTLLHPDVHWPWRDDDSVCIRVARFWSQDFDKMMDFPHEHRGESPKFALRQGPAAPIQYILKFGHEAVAEIAYYTLARALDLPYQTVYWASYSALSMPLAAMRFEPAAVEARLEGYGTRGIRAGGELVAARNPWDVFGHVALYKSVDGLEEVQWMLQDGMLFGVDAATMFADFEETRVVYAMKHGRAASVLKTMRAAAARQATLSHDWIEWTQTHTEQHYGPDATTALRQALDAIAGTDSLADVLRARLEASPSKVGRLYAELLPEYVQTRQKEMRAAGFGVRQ